MRSRADLAVNCNLTYSQHWLNSRMIQNSVLLGLIRYLRQALKSCVQFSWVIITSHYSYVLSVTHLKTFSFVIKLVLLFPHPIAHQRRQIFRTCTLVTHGLPQQMLHGFILHNSQKQLSKSCSTNFVILAEIYTYVNLSFNVQHIFLDKRSKTNQIHTFTNLQIKKQYTIRVKLASFLKTLLFRYASVLATTQKLLMIFQ